MFEIPEPAEQAPQGAAGGGSQNSYQKKKELTEHMIFLNVLRSKSYFW